MDPKSLEHVRFRAPHGRRLRSPAAKTLTAAAVIVAASFAAGTLWLRKSAAVLPSKVEPAVPTSDANVPTSAPVEMSAPPPAAVAETAEKTSVETAVEPAGTVSAPMRAMPAWTRKVVSQVWAWPKNAEAVWMKTTSMHRSRAAKPAADEGLDVQRRLVGWFPENSEGMRLKFMTREPDGRETEAFDGIGLNPAVRLAQIRALELAALQKSKNSAQARDVTVAGGQPMAELTYADGHVEVVHYDPLVFDLKGTGVKTDSRKVLFDLFGYAKTDKLQWMNDINEGAGILVFDSNTSGRSGKNGSEVFGDRTDLYGVGKPDGFPDGFAALRALVKKAVAERVLTQEAVDGGVLEAGSLKALENGYGLKLKIGGFNQKTVSLADAGIQAIALSDAKTQRIANFDGRANDLVVQPGAVYLRRDGTTGNYMNIWLRADAGAPGLSKAQDVIR